MHFRKWSLPGLIVCFAAGLSADELRPRSVIPLGGATHHVQGIEIDGSSLWVTSVDKERKRGLLLEYKLPSGDLVRSVELQDGERFHPGGLTADGDFLWIPVAEYKPKSSAVIQKRDKKTLALQTSFQVSDHIGAVAVTPEGLVGANWDARELYVWSPRGEQLRSMPNRSGVSIQDMKFVDGKLVGGGLLPDRSGVVVWMNWPSLAVSRKLPVGFTDRKVAYTHEGMTIRDGKLWLLPEDAPSRLFVFDNH